MSHGFYLQMRRMIYLGLGLTLICCGCVSREKTRMTDKQTKNISEFDQGGFSVDFWNAGKTTPVAGPNLLTAGGTNQAESAGRDQGWEKGSYVWLPVANKEAQVRMEKRAAPLMKYDMAQKSGAGTGRTLRLALPVSAYSAADPEGHEICAFYHKKLILEPLSDNVKYVLSFQYRGHSQTDVPNSRAYVRATFYDNEDPAKGKESRVYAQKTFPASSQWRKDELLFLVPKNTRCLDIRVALTGCGEVWYENLALHQVAVREKGSAVRLMPGYYLDNLYCLSSEDVGVVVFGFRNESELKLDKPNLVFQLPQGIEILDQPDLAKILEKTPCEVGKDTLVEYRIDISAWKGRIHDGTFPYPYNMWEGLPLMLKSSLPAGEPRYKARYWLEDGRYKSEPLEFDIKIVTPFPAVPAPKLFKTGAVLFLVPGFTKETAVKEWANLYKRTGFNSVHVGPSPLEKEFGRLGIERYNQPLVNGYCIVGGCEPGNKPEDAVFRLNDGKPLWEAVCPVEVYTKGPYYRGKIENDILRRILVVDRNAEQIMANWEPAGYNGQGCFCDRCKEEFRKYSNLSPEIIAKVWPKDVACEYANVWIKFRSWQHGKLMATLEESVNTIGKEAGLDSHFIPEIHFSLLTSSWAKEKSNREYAAVDYLDKLPVLAPWAPYNWYIFTDGPWDYVCGQHLSAYASSREAREFVDNRLAPEKKERLIAFPYGTYEGATQPEALAFEITTYFLNQYNGAFAYLFPGGYDDRYYRALAEANRTIAGFESFVMQGRIIQKHKLTTATPMPKPDQRFLASPCGTIDNAERWKDLSLLLSWEYEKDGKRLIAVGNFWERGESFFRLTAQELKAGEKYVLWEPEAKRCYTDKAGNIALTAAEISKGILLHVGAMRYVFFVLEPYRQGADYGKIIRPKDMKKIMDERRPRLELLNKEEKESSLPDYTKLKSLKKNRLECKPVTLGQIKTPCLEFQSADQKVVVDPANGGRIASWKIGEYEAVHCEGNYGLMLAAFWQPNLQILQPYEVIKQEATAQGLKVILQRVLAQDGGLLAGITIRKIVEVPEQGIGFKISAEIANTAEKKQVTFAYRWHNMPSVLELREGKQGWVRMRQNGRPVDFKCNGGSRVFRGVPPADKPMDFIPSNPEDRIDSNSVVFGCDWSPIRVKADFKPQNLYSILYWDGTTFEPIFPMTVLKCGETWTTEVEWSVEKD